MPEETDNSNASDKPWLFKKGQSGNPGGRPKGKSLKEYTREMLASMDDEERQEYLKGLPKEIIWKMAEGNPENKSDITTNGESISLATPELEAIATKLNEITRSNTRASIAGNGVDSNAVDAEIQD
jgi:predicted phosphoadenosine phosphosulfate sulfurtransferase